MQATTQPQEPAAAALPAVAPPASPISISTIGSDGQPLTIAVPSTVEQIQQLRSQRDALSSSRCAKALEFRAAALQIASHGLQCGHRIC